MTRPTVTATTERLYARLPELYRLADDDQADGDNGYPLLRYVSLLADQLGDLEILYDRINYVEPADGGDPDDTSDLADPHTADSAWLPWLAQLIGAHLPPASDDTGRRDTLSGAITGWQAGTRDAVAAAAQSALIGTRYVKVIDHYTGDPWLVEIRTRTTETPDPSAVLAAIVSKRAKPAGVGLVSTFYEASWDILEADLPTWADWEADGEWDVIEETGV